jgi:hypothetical protein
MTQSVSTNEFLVIESFRHVPYIWFELNVTTMYISEPVSSGSVVSGYGLDDRAIEVRSPTEVKGFFL